MPLELQDLMTRYVALGRMLQRPSDHPDVDRDVLQMLLTEMDEVASEMHTRFGMPDFSRAARGR